jgi:antitoxin CptB
LPEAGLGDGPDAAGTIELARLRWRCRRGMRELDRLLEAFLESGFRLLDAAEKQRFAEILELPDPDLHAYLVGRATPADPAIARLLHCIRTSHPAET